MVVVLKDIRGLLTMTTVTLATALDQILDGIVSHLTIEQAAGKSLDDVLVIARGDRSEPAPDVPAIYIVPEKMKVSNQQARNFNLMEWWELPVTLYGMIHHDIPADGYQTATDLAARARAVVLTANSRNMSLSYVKDIRSDEFDPAGPWNREGDYYRASATIVVLFSVRG